MTTVKGMQAGWNRKNLRQRDARLSARLSDATPILPFTQPIGAYLITPKYAVNDREP